MQKSFIIILVLFIITGVFAISNSAVVTIDFIFTEVLLSQAIVIFVSVLLGFMMASIFGFVRQRALKKNIKEVNKENEDLKAEAYKLKVQGYNYREETLKDKAEAENEFENELENESENYHQE